MIAQSKPQRRTFHRVRFPLAEQPRWIAGGTRFSVVDLAEASCRLRPIGDVYVEVGQMYRGVMHFSDGDQLWVEGEVLRLEDREIIVRFTKGLSFKKLMALQRWLVQKYPALRDADQIQSIRSK